MDHGENKHCTETNFSCRYHYRGGHACGAQDSPDRVQLRPKHGQYPTLDFEVPRQQYELEKVERLMENAYTRGVQDRSREIAGMFKMLIGV